MARSTPSETDRGAVTATGEPAGPGAGGGSLRRAFPLAFERLVLRRTPNDYLVLPPGFRAAAEPHRRSPAYPVGADRLEAALRAVAAAEPRTKLSREDRAARQIEYVARSRVFRFPDVVTVGVFPLGPGNSALAIYARARYGAFDFGVNRRRVEAWLALLARELAAVGDHRAAG